MQRRKLLQYAGLATGLSLGRIPVWASAKNQFSALAEENDNILVVIQMLGGNDGLNTIIPADDDRYYSKYRPKLGIPKTKLLKLRDGTYMNPVLQSGLNNGLYGLFNEGKLAVIQGIGYPNNSLSHFRSTDIWLSATMPVNDAQHLETGWLGRFSEKLNGDTLPLHPTCMNIGNATSLLFQGTKGDLSIAVENPNDFYERGKDILSGDTMLSDNSAFAAERNFLLDLSVQSNKYSAVIKKAFDAGKNTANYEADALSKELQLVARLISGGLKTKVYLVSIDGFDTHANQGADDGKHASLLKQISNSVAAFMADLKSQKISEKVVGMTVSEFGRRPEENASLGSDHGAASVMFMFGDAVNGKIYGQNLSFDKLDSNKDFLYQFDYRRVYDELMVKWFKTETAVAKEILGNRFDVIENGIFSNRQVLSNEPQSSLNQSIAYPNPTADGFFNLQINLTKPSEITIQVTDIQGLIIVQNLPNRLPAGVHHLPMHTGENKGLYLVDIQTNEKREVLKVMKI
jgi:uncharacterized protein (DUF1501 family)